MHWLRLAAAALALALGQSREEARTLITLKEVEPLIEAKYRCGIWYNSWTFGWLGVVLQLSSWSKSGTESRGWPLTAPKHGCSAGGREAGPPTGAHTPLSVLAAVPRPAPAARSWPRCRSCCTTVSVRCPTPAACHWALVGCDLVHGPLINEASCWHLAAASHSRYALFRNPVAPPTRGHLGTAGSRTIAAQLLLQFSFRLDSIYPGHAIQAPTARAKLRGCWAPS